LARHCGQSGRLGRVDERLRTTAGYAAEHLAFDELHAELAAAAAGGGAGSPLLEPLKLWPLRPSGRPSPCLPNPGYAPPDDVVAPARRQVADTACELDYWLDRATGRPSAADPGWYFAGRRDLNAPVAGFLVGGDGVLLVTGAAGTGKSVIIARARHAQRCRVPRRPAVRRRHRGRATWDSAVGPRVQPPTPCPRWRSRPACCP
jgi:hypothetical protein